MLPLFFHTLKLFTWDLVYNLGYWPVWWYGQGLKDFFVFFRKQIKNVWHNRGLDVLIKNWFKPMYGQNDLQGRIISLFFRTLVIIWRSIFFIFWVVILVVLFASWVFIIPLSIAMLIRLFLLT